LKKLKHELSEALLTEVPGNNYALATLEVEQVISTILSCRVAE
jgi:hypothetical protein